MKHPLIDEASTRLILIEGIPGAGKTSTARFIESELQKAQQMPHLFLEGNLDHPADYESVACIPADEFESLCQAWADEQPTLRQFAKNRNGDYFLPYRKLIETHAIPQPLFEILAGYEVYELSAEKFQRIITQRWMEFAKKAQTENNTYIFECCFLQNPLTTLLAKHNLPVAVANQMIFELAEVIKPLHPRLIYLEPANIRQTFEKSARERPPEWLAYVIQYITGQAWGQANAEHGFEGMVHFYEHRRDVEKALLPRLGLPFLWVDQADETWQTTHEKIYTFIN